MTIEKIKKEVQQKLNVNLSSASRRRHFTYSRALYFKLCRDYTDKTFTELAETVGLTNHATVMNAINSTMYDVEYEKKYWNVYKKLDREFGKKPTAEQEVKQLKIKVQELEQVIEGYRLKIIG
jgi:chromosomal replication initiation ATPase DnaA